MNADPADPRAVLVSPEDLLQTVIIATEGMHSAECAQRIELAIEGARGVAAVRAEADAARVTVTYDPRLTSVSALHDRIEAAGYQPDPYADLDFREDGETE